MTYDLPQRKRVISDVWRGFSMAWIARQRYSPSLTTIKAWVRTFRRYASYATPSGGRRLRRRKILRAHQDLLIDFLEKVNPTLYLDEMQRWLHRQVMVKYSASGICAMLICRGVTRKKLSLISSRRCELERNRFMRFIQFRVEASQVVCLDETRKDSRCCYRRYGRGRGRRVVMGCNMLTQLWSFSALGIMSIDGMLDVAIHNVRGVTAQMFFDDCFYHVLPLCNPFPGPKSVIILDNSLLHYCPGLRQLFESNGVVVQHTSAYSYDLMPIEKAFSKAKAILQRQDSDEINANPRLALRRALMSVNANDAAGYYRSCGFEVTEVAPGIFI